MQDYTFVHLLPIIKEVLYIFGKIICGNGTSVEWDGERDILQSGDATIARYMASTGEIILEETPKHLNVQPSAFLEIIQDREKIEERFPGELIHLGSVSRKYISKIPSTTNNSGATAVIIPGSFDLVIIRDEDVDQILDFMKEIENGQSP